MKNGLLISKYLFLWWEWLVLIIESSPTDGNLPGHWRSSVGCWDVGFEPATAVRLYTCESPTEAISLWPSVAALQKKPSPYSDAGTGWRRTKRLGWRKMFSTYMSNFFSMLCHPSRKNPTVFYIQVGKFRQCRESSTVFYIQVGKFQQCSINS